MPSKAYETIRVESGAPVAQLVLARPPLNILNIAMLEEIADALDALAARNDMRVLVIAAEGKAFSAGVDIEDHVGDRVTPMIAAFHGVFRRLAAFEPPTVAVVRGPALGGGCELAAFCDFVIAADTATFGQPEIKLGLFPPVTAAAFPTFVGGKKALEMMLTGDTVDAHEAARIGLVSRVVPPSKLDNAVDELVGRLASYSGIALRLAKKAYTASIDQPFTVALDRAEEIYLAELMKTRDAQEGLMAFREKRPPRWRDA
jgi:cyclohexa-1,5-dienecarbonyl-CoA hydratase